MVSDDALCRNMSQGKLWIGKKKQTFTTYYCYINMLTNEACLQIYVYYVPENICIFHLGVALQARIAESLKNGTGSGVCSLTSERIAPAKAMEEAQGERRGGDTSTGDKKGKFFRMHEGKKESRHCCRKGRFRQRQNIPAKRLLMMGAPIMTVTICSEVHVGSPPLAGVERHPP